MAYVGSTGRSLDFARGSEDDTLVAPPSGSLLYPLPTGRLYAHGDLIVWQSEPPPLEPGNLWLCPAVASCMCIHSTAHCTRRHSFVYSNCKDCNGKRPLSGSDTPTSDTSRLTSSPHLTHCARYVL